MGFDSITRFATALADGEVSSTEMTRHCLAKIEASDRVLPLNVIIALNPSALADAAELDQEVRARGPRSRLHGVPVIIKDNIDLAGLPTTAGSAVLRDMRPTHDAAVAQALKVAGAVILGKANMSEFAASNGRPGYSSAGGVTRNPLAPTRHASGSSSGSAAAVAAGFAFAALGTDTFGSVRAPASVTGCVGLRPSHGLLSLAGVFPLAPSFDVVGPIARTAADLPILMNALAGGRPSYREALHGDALRSARLAVFDALPTMHADVAATFERSVAALGRVGATVRTVPSSPDGDTLMRTLLTPIATSEFAAAVQAYFARTPESPENVAALLAQVEAHAACHPASATSPETIAMLRRLVADVAPLAMPEQPLAELRANARRWFADGVAAVIFPTHLGVPGGAIDGVAPANVPGPYNPMAASYLASALGLPEITVPAGRSTDGLPIGLSFMGRPGSEQQLMDLAFSFETGIVLRPGVSKL